ncbi:hypothetical protein [Agrobacterium sp. CG674]
MTESSGSLRNISVSFEAAYEAVALLENSQVEESGGVTVYSGRHPEHGNIHIAIPAIGNGMLLLPFALHDF